MTSNLLLFGVLRKTPEAFFVTYFRPFIIGDVRNAATLFEALQALALLVLSIFVFIKVGIFKSFKLILGTATYVHSCFLLSSSVSPWDLHPITLELFLATKYPEYRSTLLPFRLFTTWVISSPRIY